MSLPQPNDGFEWTQAAWGHVLRCRPLLDVASHLFTARNLRLRDDSQEWEAVAEEIGVPLPHVLLLRQVHGAVVVIGRRPERQHPWAPPEADAIVSAESDTAVGVRVADCAPVLLADRRTGVVAAAHAGWRGTAKGAAAAAVAALGQEFGSAPSDLVAAIGPCLGPCCGEVGEEVVEAFRSAGHGAEALGRWFSRGPSGRPHVDLWTANGDQLVSAGIPADQVHVARLCTRTHGGVLHSYRLDGQNAGRMLAAIRPSVAAPPRPSLDSIIDPPPY